MCKNLSNQILSFLFFFFFNFSTCQRTAHSINHYRTAQVRTETHQSCTVIHKIINSYVAESNIRTAWSCNYVIKLKRVANSIIMQLCSDAPGFSFPRYKKTWWSGTKPCKCHIAVPFFFHENENNIPNLYLLKAVVLLRLKLTVSLRLGSLSVICLSENTERSDQFSLLLDDLWSEQSQEQILAYSTLMPLFHTHTNKMFAM